MAFWAAFCVLWAIISPTFGFQVGAGSKRFKSKKGHKKLVLRVWVEGWGSGLKFMN